MERGYDEKMKRKQILRVRLYSRNGALETEKPQIS